MDQAPVPAATQLQQYNGSIAAPGLLHCSDAATTTSVAAAHKQSYPTQQAEHPQGPAVGPEQQVLHKLPPYNAPCVHKQLAAHKRATGANSRSRRRQGTFGEGVIAATEQGNAEGGAAADTGNFAGPRSGGSSRAASASAALLPVVDDVDHYCQSQQQQQQQQPQQPSQLKDPGAMHRTNTAASASTAAAHEHSYLSLQAARLQVPTAGSSQQTPHKQPNIPFVPRQLAGCKPAMGANRRTGRCRGSCVHGASKSTIEQQDAGGRPTSVAPANQRPNGHAQSLSRSSSASAALLPVVVYLDPYRQLQQQQQKQSQLKDPGVGGLRGIASSLLGAETAHNGPQQGEGASAGAQWPCQQQQQHRSVSVLDTAVVAELPLQLKMGLPAADSMPDCTRPPHMPGVQASTAAVGAACANTKQQELQVLGLQQQQQQEQELPSLQQPEAPQQQSRDCADVAGLAELLQEQTTVSPGPECDSAQRKCTLHAQAGAQDEQAATAAAARSNSRQCKHCKAPTSSASGAVYCTNNHELLALSSMWYQQGDSATAQPVKKQGHGPQQQQQQSQGALQQRCWKNGKRVRLQLDDAQLRGLPQHTEQQQQQGVISRDGGRQAAHEVFNAGAPVAASVPKHKQVEASNAGGKYASAAVALELATCTTGVCQQESVAAGVANNSTAEEVPVTAVLEPPNSPQHREEAQDPSALTPSPSQQLSKKARRMINPGTVEPGVSEAAVTEDAGVLTNQNQGSLDLTPGRLGPAVDAVPAMEENRSLSAAVVDHTGGEPKHLAGARGGGSSSSIVSAKNSLEGLQAAPGCAVTAASCSLGKAAVMVDHHQHLQQAAAAEEEEEEEERLPDWVYQPVLMLKASQHHPHKQQQQLVAQYETVPVTAAAAGNGLVASVDGHAAAAQPGDSTVLAGRPAHAADPAVPAQNLTADGMGKMANQQQAQMPVHLATTQQQQQQLPQQRDQDQYQQAAGSDLQQQQDLLQDIQQELPQPPGPAPPPAAAAAAAAAAAVERAVARNAGKPPKRRGREPWGPDLAGVSLGCGKCRRAVRGCLVCRARARRRLAQQRQQQQRTAAVELPAAQHAADIEQHAAAVAAGSTAHDAADVRRPIKRKRLLSSAAGTELVAKKKGTAEANASATALRQMQGASSGGAAAAAAAVVQRSRKCAHDSSNTSTGKQVVPHAAKPKQKQQKQQQQQQQQQAPPQTAPGCQSALQQQQQPVQQVAHESWLPQLLQCQVFYQDCPKCKRPKCPVRWFDVLDPSSTHCNGCRPSNAVKLGKAQPQEQLQELIQQAKQQQRPLLLPLISSSSTVRRNGVTVCVGAVNPADMAALSVHCTDVQFKLRNQGMDITKQIILLHPGTASLSKRQHCATCEQLQQQPDGGHTYCSLWCKLQQAGLEAFALDERAGVVQQQGSVKRPISNQQQQQQQQLQAKRPISSQQQKQEAAKRQGSNQQQQQSPAKQLSKQQQELAAATGCSELSWLRALLQCSHLQQQCTKTTCQLVTNKVRSVVRYFELSSGSSNCSAATYCECCRPDEAGTAGSSSSSGESTAEQLQHGQPLLLTLHSSGKSDPLQKAAADPDHLQRLGATISDVKPFLRDTGHGTHRTLLLLHNSPHSLKDNMCRSCQGITENSSQYQYCSLACKLRQAGLQAFSTQQGMQQQRPAGVPAAVGAAAQSPTPRKYKFPPLRLSGPQVTWNLEAWQERQHAGLTRLGQLHDSQQQKKQQLQQHEQGSDRTTITASNTAGTRTAAAAAHAGAASAEGSGGSTTAALSRLSLGLAVAAAAAAGSEPAADAARPPATAVLQLVHDSGCPTAAIWQDWQASHVSPSDVRLFCHVKQGVDLNSSQFAGRSTVQQCMLNTRVNAKWGDTSLVQAFLDSLAEVLLCCNVLQLSAKPAAQAEASGPLLTTPAATAGSAMPTAQQDERVTGCGLDDCIAAAGAAAAAGQLLVAGTACSFSSVDCKQRAQEAAAAKTGQEPQTTQPCGSSATALGCTDAVSAPAAVTCSAQSAPLAAAGLRHILLVSGTDVPVKLLPAGALPAGVTQYGSYDYPKDHVADLQEVMYEGMLEAGFEHSDARKWTSCLVPHHQWMCVSLEHALVLVAMRDVILKVANAVHAAWQEANCGIAADEYVLMTALRVAGCVQALKPCRTPAQIRLCQPGVAANCHPTQVMYPAPQRWIQQLQQDKHIETASAGAAVRAAEEQPSGPSAEGKAQQAVDGTLATAVCSSAQGLSDLRLASFTADKHPVTWRAVKEVVWCEDEEQDTAYAVKLTLQHLLAIAAERGCLALRKVDCGEDWDARQQVLRLLQRTWLGDAPKVRSMKRVEMVQQHNIA